MLLSLWGGDCQVECVYAVDMSPDKRKITSPADPQLEELCEQLRQLAPSLPAASWPEEQLACCGRQGVFEWFLAPQWGGQAWSDADVIRGYLALSASCLTTSFVITQRTAACQRIAASENETVKRQLLPDLASGSIFATVGISHLTTSRRHLRKDVLRAAETPAGFRLDGFSPWVTGAPSAEFVVTGATLDDGRQIMIVLPTDTPGVSVPAAADLVALSESQTGPVQCDRVEVHRRWLLAGPVENVMQQGVGARTGGLQTSTLAIGLAGTAIDYLDQETTKRPDLEPPTESLRSDWQVLKDQLLDAAAGESVCSNEELRSRANSLVLRSTQAALSAAKGSGYVTGHPAGRWCTEALFFLVWSCPQTVVAANLCELAGLSE